MGMKGSKNRWVRRREKCVTVISDEISPRRNDASKILSWLMGL